MCFLCKPVYDEYVKQSGYPHYIRVFRNKIHTEQRPINEMYNVLDEIMFNELSNYKASMKSSIRHIIRDFIYFVCEQEEVRVSEPVPTYRMHSDGSYEQVI